MANEILQPPLESPATRSANAAVQRDADYYDASQASETHLRDYWKIIRKHARRIAIIVVASLGLALLYNVLSPTTYTARALLKIEPQNPTVTGVRDMLPSQLETGPYDYYQTQFALLESGSLAARVIKQLQLANHRVFNGEEDGFDPLGIVVRWVNGAIRSLAQAVGSLFSSDWAPPPSGPPVYELGVAPHLVGRYQQYLKVDPVRNTRLVAIVFTTPDPLLSQRLANNHPSAFIQMILENRFSLTREAKDFLDTKLAELRERVRHSENALQRFRQQHGVVSFEKGENIVVDRLVDLNKQLTKTKAERIEAESLYQLTRNKNTQYLAQVLNNPLIQQLKGSLAALESERGRLLSIYTHEHPRVQELAQQIGESRRILSAEIGTIVRGIESSYASARAREEALAAESKRQTNAALNLKEVGVEYAVLNEEVTVNRGLYDNVLKRLYETNVANDLAAANIEIIQRAELPQAPSSPTFFRNLVIALILGLFLAIGSAFFTEYMDGTLGTPQAVWAAVTLSTLGVVPHLKLLPKSAPPPLLKKRATASLEATPGKNAEFVSHELIVARDRLSLIAESYRTIRTALLLSQAERPPKTVLLTSPSPGDGKTVTALNLAISLAQSGLRVLIIDADLRKGRCHKLLNVMSLQGLANVLSGQVSFAAAVRHSVITNLDLLPRGALPPNPTDLLMSAKMRRLLEEAGAEYDHIVIDSPPAIALSDAAVLASLCDGVLLVFDGRKTTTPAARDAVQKLDRVGAHILGVILNGIDLHDPEYHEYRAYYPAYREAGEEPATRALDEYVIDSQNGGRERGERA